eukprot:31435-Pelagococcus_subviridis.AAC.5
MLGMTYMRFNLFFLFAAAYLRRIATRGRVQRELLLPHGALQILGPPRRRARDGVAVRVVAPRSRLGRLRAELPRFRGCVAAVRVRRRRRRGGVDALLVALHVEPPDFDPAARGHDGLGLGGFARARPGDLKFHRVVRPRDVRVRRAPLASLPALPSLALFPLRRRRISRRVRRVREAFVPRGPAVQAPAGGRRAVVVVVWLWRFRPRRRPPPRAAAAAAAAAAIPRGFVVAAAAAAAEVDRAAARGGAGGVVAVREHVRHGRSVADAREHRHQHAAVDASAANFVGLSAAALPRRFLLRRARAPGAPGAPEGPGLRAGGRAARRVLVRGGRGAARAAAAALAPLAGGVVPVRVPSVDDAIPGGASASLREELRAQRAARQVNRLVHPPVPRVELREREQRRHLHGEGVVRREVERRPAIRLVVVVAAAVAAHRNLARVARSEPRAGEPLARVLAVRLHRALAAAARRGLAEPRRRPRRRVPRAPFPVREVQGPVGVGVLPRRRQARVTRLHEVRFVR